MEDNKGIYYDSSLEEKSKIKLDGSNLRFLPNNFSMYYDHLPNIYHNNISTYKLPDSMASMKIARLSNSIESVWENEELCSITPQEMGVLREILENAKSRINRKVIGLNNVIEDNRNETINKILKK